MISSWIPCALPTNRMNRMMVSLVGLVISLKKCQQYHRMVLLSTNATILWNFISQQTGNSSLWYVV